jgi:hypothetical protein
MTPTLSPSELADDLPTRLAEHAELQRAWHSFELGDIAPAPLALDETAALLDEAALALREREAECEMLREHTSCCLDERDENLARIRQLEEARTPTDADVERVASAVFAAMRTPGKPHWVPCGNSFKQDEARRYARAAIAAMPVPDAVATARVRELEEALRPFAKEAERFDHPIVTYTDDQKVDRCRHVAVGHLRRARAALREGGNG